MGHVRSMGTAHIVSADTEIKKVEYLLSDPERAMLLELIAQAQRAAEQAAAPFNMQLQGAIGLIYRQQGLKDQWQLTDDKTKLVKVEG